MSLYPSLEDMKAAEMITAQVSAMQRSVTYQPSAPVPTFTRGTSSPYAIDLGQPTRANGSVASAYPSLGEFLGLELSEDVIRENMPEYLSNTTYNAIAVPSTTVLQNNVGVGIIAPISGSNAIVKSMVTHGVRQASVVKDSKGKIGMRVRAMHTGVFACLVIEGSPAAKAGIRFGDQILQIDGVDMAGMTVEKVHGIFKKKRAGESFLIAVRDRPYERSVTLVRDSLGNVGFQFKDGKIINIVKDSSAARNGLLTEHSLLEINGKNVIGLKDKEITQVINGLEGNALNVTIMPTFLYTHMVKEMNSSLFGKMDHSEQL